MALIAAPSSKQGKTVFTASLARLLRQQGKRVQVFKLGPDYLDPTILEQASGQQVFNLDVWIMGETYCRTLLAQAARVNDVILVESLMGLHDNQPSNAQVAQLFDLPIVLVMNVAKFAQTAKAIVEGLTLYGDGVSIKNVVGNLVGSDNHHRLMAESIGDQYAGSVRRNDVMVLKERHLGLVQAKELTNLDRQLDGCAKVLEESSLKLILPSITFKARTYPSIPKLLEGKTIAIAKDAAFSFIYPGNVQTLLSLGAQICYFSPLNNDILPKCDAVWLPGGYPELYLERLNDANRTKQSLLEHHQSHAPLLAECGGMMACCESVTDIEGNRFEAFGLVAGNTQIHPRFQSIGLQEIEYEAGILRGHSFHHSTLQTVLPAFRTATKQNGEKGENVYRIGGGNV